MSNEEIVKQIQSGVDITKNQERLWNNNKGMVYKIVRQCGADNDMAEDLAQQGFIGLINATRQYDPDGEALFITYAIPFIRGSVYRYMASTYNIFHIPQYMRKRLREYEKLMREAKDSGQKLSDDEICRSLSISGQALKDINNTLERISIYSLDETIPGGDEENTLLDSIASDENIEQLAISGLWEKELHETLQKAFTVLDEKTLEMIKCVYYLGFSKSSVAEMLHCSQVYVGSRIERGFKKIRDKYGTELADFMYPGFRYQNEEDATQAGDKQADTSEDDCNLFLI